jgi:hypothetical protein
MDLGGQVGLPQADRPSLRPLVLRLMPHWSGSSGFSNCKQDSAVRRNLEAKHAVEHMHYCSHYSIRSPYQGVADASTPVASVNK